MTSDAPEHFVRKEKSKWPDPEKASMLKDAKIRNIMHNSLDNVMHQYDLDILTLDEVYGMLKTHDLEIQQRKNKKGQKMKAVALNAETHKGKEKMSERSRRRNILEESDTDDSSDPDTDTDEDSEIDLDDRQVVEMTTMLVKSFRMMRFANPQRRGGSNKKFSGDGKGKAHTTSILELKVFWVAMVTFFGMCEVVSTDIKGLQRMRNKASTDVSKASTDNIHQRMSASTDKASTANASTNKASMDKGSTDKASTDKSFNGCLVQ
ncbi:hypothetical protein AgCh_023184 [Apium graveolens]